MTDTATIELARAIPAVGAQAYRGMSGGWPSILDRLVSVLAEV